MKFSISSLELTNYRQYQGKQILKFSNDKNKNVFVILGKNGAGKSNILNALTWCFYGLEVHKDQNNHYSDGMPIINVQEIESLKPNQSTSAEVRVNIKTEGGPWTIIRRFDAKKNDVGDLLIGGSKLTVIYPVGGQDKYIEGEETQILINNLLPEALRNFFFIDGEQLREFFKYKGSSEIAEAIDKVSQMELIDKAAKNLEKYRKSLRRDVKATTPKLQQVQNEIISIQEEIEFRQNFIKNYEKAIEKDIVDLHEVEGFLRQYNEPKIAVLQSERDSLIKDINYFKLQIAEKEINRNNYLVEIAPSIFLKEEIETAYKLIQYKVDKGELPPKVKETFVRELIERGTCICGNELTDQAKAELASYSKKLTLSELSEVCIYGKTTIEEILSDVSEFSNVIDKYNGDIESLKDLYDGKKRREEQISNILSEHDIDEIRRYEERRRQLNEAIDHKKREILITSKDIEKNNYQLKMKEGEERLELSKDKKNIILKNKLQIVQDALETLAEIELIVKTKIRNLVETRTKENFNKLIRKKTAFKNIIIDDDFNVKVIHANNYNVINDLSAGEYMILGLSFMSALMTISGFHAPVIIDTPLGKIDKEHRDYITTELPKFLEGTQLILLVTPTEYDDKVQENLNTYLLKDSFFEIFENDSNTVSEVKQHDR
ncbi:DNA sulfur modification protein DndD [Methanocalculus alkaliphilus]|uniref:AAA family ATPase n=1 Tax=Methanocalculus alkaliphilus TaxID=768730 RepID=UPI0020A0E1FC|nr:AAA family ATPase [Methanocalculus alkaliphilus]MCP1715514.1 DNA sulfur modification protein DndD [Methanocalculus alkaliphilus]